MMFNFFKSKKRLTGVLIVVAVAVSGIAIANRGKSPEFELTKVRKGDLASVVTVTGKVKPAESVELAFERSGRVAGAFIKVGDEVKNGQVLAVLDNSDLAAQLLQAEANLAAEQAKLSELQKGARSEELQLSRSKVLSAESALFDAKLNRQNAERKAQADLDNVCSAALSAAIIAANEAKNSLLVLSDIQSLYFRGSAQDELKLADTKAEAVEVLLGASGAGRWDAEFISTLAGGAWGLTQTALVNQGEANIDAALISLNAALQKVKAALDAVPHKTVLSSSDRSSLNAEKDTIASQLTALVAKQQAILVQKTGNVNTLSTAEAQVNAAQNSLSQAQAEFALREAGSDPEQIKAQSSRVKAAEAQVKNYQSLLSKTFIRSPFAGVVTKKDMRVGEIVGASTPVAGVLSSKLYEIEAYVPEADIAKVKIGESAEVTLDAYGDDEKFRARVAAIDPAETLIEGITTYRITLEFEADDERVRSGMTANLEITAQKRSGSLIVPTRAVYGRNGDKFVKVLDDQEVKEVRVITGLRGSDGNLEILEGLDENTSVIVGEK